MFRPIYPYNYTNLNEEHMVLQEYKIKSITLYN